MPYFWDNNTSINADRGKVVKRLISNSPEETRYAGEELAITLLPGDIVAIFGSLGSGKTVLIKGISRGLGVVEKVTSPTFTLIHEYIGRVPVYHFDFCRIESPEEIFELGCDEYFYREGICLVEWPDRIVEYLPKKRIDIYLRIHFNKELKYEREILICKL